jgi:hypothetical protein
MHKGTGMTLSFKRNDFYQLYYLETSFKKSGLVNAVEDQILAQGALDPVVDQILAGDALDTVEFINIDINEAHEVLGHPDEQKQKKWI